MLSPRVCLFLENNVDLFALITRVRNDEEVDETLYAIRWAAMASRANATRTATSAADPAPSPSMTPREAAAHGNLKAGSVRAAIRRHRLPATKIAGRWQINPADLDTYLRSSP